MITEPSIEPGEEYSRYLPDDTPVPGPDADGDLTYSDYYPNKKAN